MLSLCILLAVGFLALLFFYDPYITSLLNIGAAEDVRFWLTAIPVSIALIAIMVVGTWIGWKITTTPPSKPIEEFTSET